MTQKKIKTLSLFSGAGGLDIGFHAAGFDILGCVEIEPAYAASLERNKGPNRLFGPKLNVHCEDIRNFDPTPYVGVGIECVIGGPPCQTFSAAGRRSGGVLGTIDPRGRLFESYCRILKAISPAVFVFENVYGLPGANDGAPWREICTAFGRLGYELRAEVVDSADYGVPQHRERLIIVGYRNHQLSYKFPMPTHGPDSLNGPDLVSIYDAIKDLQDPNEPSHEFDGLYGHLLQLVPEGLNYSFFTREMGYPKPFFAWRSKFHDFLYKVDRHSPSRTIKAQPGKFTGPFHWKNRHFTVPELKRLQSFPDEYELVGKFGKIVEQIGNSVPPRLAQVIAHSIKEQLLRPAKTLRYPVREPGFASTFRQRQRERTNHFKAVAEREIAERFPNVTTLDPPKANSKAQFFVGYDGFFDKETVAELPKPKSTKRFYNVAEERTGHRIDLAIAPVTGRAKRQIEITISGLSKYLLDVDVLHCTAAMCDHDDIFRVWDLIEDSLTKDSQFFTLIDIYGHYANRGDTVKVSTKLSGERKSSLEKAVEFFGSSKNCGQFLSNSEFGLAVGCDSREARELVFKLREMRWDVRLPETHATIRDDRMLCTYPFPLLSGKAQLERRKSA
ncbi:DNA cytosine methyltransferase [Xanthomonas translucens]|uniref:DNA cytosine methyltransferase n=1 Tax=Xanthomonas campestris pv. translucens TaxID=343 RepID=UPI001F28EE5A|nr:DNA cytosine methyltransferase [Xanthomonas translucens]UKE50519.1 DNA cytosine methyltransferase [Xanthomonas translucens]